MRLPRRGLLGLALAGGLLAGCGQTTVSTTSATTAPAGTVELTQVTYQGLDAAVKEQRGKVVLIDVWFLG
jgi:ABC-type glycerol-3-phosphate transport system substrate-binding protein